MTIEDKDIPKEYEGTGKVVSVLGGMSLGGLVGSILVAIPAAVAVSVGASLDSVVPFVAGANVAGTAIGGINGYNASENGRKQFERTQYTMHTEKLLNERAGKAQLER